MYIWNYHQVSTCYAKSKGNCLLYCPKQHDFANVYLDSRVVSTVYLEIINVKNLRAGEAQNGDPYEVCHVDPG